jgi:coproporphyrinogen III oxidase
LPAVFGIASKNNGTGSRNWRYFEMYDDNGNVIQQWFGGGQDLTPIIYLKMRFIFIKPVKLVISII